MPALGSERKIFSCRLGHIVSPLAGTIFEKSSTPLHLWFLAIYLMSETRSGVSAKTLERILGVTYKTAWRIFKQIRSLMDEEEILTGTVEVDETYIGGKDWFRGKKWWANWGALEKTILLGFVERGGRVRTMIIPTTDGFVLSQKVPDYVTKDTSIVTDGHFGYKQLPKLGFKHSVINHTVHYVDKENPEIHTNTIEGFWGQMKPGISGVYRGVSRKYLQNYADEYGFRYSYRKAGIFKTLVQRANTKMVEKDIPF